MFWNGRRLGDTRQPFASTLATMNKRRTAWTVAIQRGAASHWKLALGCAACAWLVTRFIQAQSAGTDPAEERRLASERADYFERKGQAAKAARPTRRPGSGESAACPAAPAQPVRAEDLVSPPRYVPPAESAADTSVSRRDVVQVRDGGYDWQGASALFDTGNELRSLVRPGAFVLYVRATRTSLLRVVRTGGAGQLAPWASSTVRTPYAYQPQACRTYRVPCGAPQATNRLRCSTRRLRAATASTPKAAPAASSRSPSVG